MRRQTPWGPHSKGQDGRASPWSHAPPGGTGSGRHVRVLVMTELEGNVNWGRKGAGVPVPGAGAPAWAFPWETDLLPSGLPRLAQTRSRSCRASGPLCLNLCRAFGEGRLRTGRF